MSTEMVEGSQKKLTSSAQGLMKKMIWTWYLLGSFGQSQQATIGHQRIKGRDGVRQSTDLVGHHGGHLGGTNQIPAFRMGKSNAYPREDTGINFYKTIVQGVGFMCNNSIHDVEFVLCIK